MRHVSSTFSTLFFYLALLAIGSLGSACGSDGSDDPDTEQDSVPSDASDDVLPDGEDGVADVTGDSDSSDQVDQADGSDVAEKPLELATTAFEPGGEIPLPYQCGEIAAGPGEDITPELSWSGGPETTMSWAIIMDDVDSGVVHWVIYDIPADVEMLAEGVPTGYELDEPASAKQAEIQMSGYFGYFGPCSGAATNTYRWTIHAVPTSTLNGVSQSTTEYEMVPIIQEQSIESASFSGES